jgi:RimJ/RimL family protein N-acetyltransferase
VAEPWLTDGVVSLRPWTVDDVTDLVAAVDGDPEITRWLDNIPQPYTAADARAFISGEIIPSETAYAITDPGGRILGGIGIHPDAQGDAHEIGYWVRRDARGRGVVTRALVLHSRQAIADGAERVFLRADPENIGSCRAAEKAGFRRDGVLRSAHWNPRMGRRQDHAIFSLLPSDLA